jgi:hypothetical protein
MVKRRQNATITQGLTSDNSFVVCVRAFVPPDAVWCHAQHFFSTSYANLLNSMSLVTVSVGIGETGIGIGMSA